MALPRFTADTALGRAHRRYRGTARAPGAPAGQVTGQMFEGDDMGADMENGAQSGGFDEDDDVSFEFDDNDGE